MSIWILNSLTIQFTFCFRKPKKAGVLWGLTDFPTFSLHFLQVKTTKVFCNASSQIILQCSCNFRRDKKSINWSQVLSGVILQFIFGLTILRWETGAQVLVTTQIFFLLLIPYTNNKAFWTLLKKKQRHKSSRKDCSPCFSLKGKSVFFQRTEKVTKLIRPDWAQDLRVLGGQSGPVPQLQLQRHQDGIWASCQQCSIHTRQDLKT